MEHKPIYLDGVDVSGCIYLPYCEDKQGNCGNNPNCYFKQLTRKTQECETLTSQLDFEVQKKECLEQECEELKDYARRQENQREEYYKEYLKLSQECEELENKIKKLRKNLALVIEINDHCYEALEEIKEYTREQFCDNCEDIGSTEYTCHCEYCEYQEYFDIINKAKGEGND